jgi:hypothetical protein
MTPTIIFTSGSKPRKSHFTVPDDRRVSDALVMDATPLRLTQEQDAETGMDGENVFQHMSCFLAVITRFLCSHIL